MLQSVKNVPKVIHYKSKYYHVKLINKYNEVHHFNMCYIQHHPDQRLQKVRLELDI